LSRGFQDRLRENIDRTTRVQNVQALHELIKQNLEKGLELEEMLHNTDNFIIAKVFRTVTLSNKDLSHGAICKKTQHIDRRENYQRTEYDSESSHNEESRTRYTTYTDHQVPRRTQRPYKQYDTQERRSKPVYEKHYRSRPKYEDYQYRPRKYVATLAQLL